LVPYLPGLRSLTVRDVPDGEDWLEELLTVSPKEEQTGLKTQAEQTVGTDGDDEYKGKPRFPSLRHLSLPSTSLFGFPEIPYTTLTHLDLSSNLLNTIPSSLSALTSLESVNLSSNMIESVRGVENILPSLKAINLRHNRIDCLSGLDRLSRLERVDVRRNELYESDEVGRLALCPNLKEVWVGAGNPYLDREEEWRINVFRAFAEEGRETALLDGYEMTWAEKRTVQAELQKMGKKAGPCSPNQSESRSSRHVETSQHPNSVKTPAATLRKDPFDGGAATKTMRVHHSHASNPAEVDSGRSTPLNKRKRQRIVDLDGTVRMASESDDGGTARGLQGLKLGSNSSGGEGGITGPVVGLGQLTSEPDQASLLEAMGAEEPGNKQVGPSTTTSSHIRSRTTDHDQGEDPPVRAAGRTEKKSRRARASASVWEPSAGQEGSSDLSPEELRARMEALKMEVGDSWLKVLAGQQQQQQQQQQQTIAHATRKPPRVVEEEPGDPGSQVSRTDQEDPDQAVVQVVKRSKAKKKAVGEIK
jgi:hypothetical protein